MDKLRMRFRKVNRSIYISHLDLMHTFQRAFSRAGYNLKYSEGFNPHPQMSIALPLSVGTGSLCEIMDFKLKDDACLDTFSQDISAALPEGIDVFEVYEAQRKIVELKWIEVEGLFEYDNNNSADYISLLENFFSQDNIIIDKKSKRGFGKFNLKNGIRKIDFSETENAVKLQALISAQDPTINPDLLVDSLRQLSPSICPDFAKFTRLETYDSQMNIFR